MSGTGDEQDRRVGQRRAGADRRFGERRRPERAAAGRRVAFANDRRLAERRVSNLALQPA